MNVKSKRIVLQLHAILGLLSGLIVFVVCITGCILVFEREISGLFNEDQNIDLSKQPTLYPSVLLEKISEQLPELLVTGFGYAPKGKAVNVYYKDGQKYVSATVNPYTGHIINKEVGRLHFFTSVEQGHRSLWLPRTWGRKIVGFGTLAFVITLLSGLVLWFPKRWSATARKQRLSINFSAKLKQLNYQLHNVLGFYVSIIALVIAFTGMVWSFEWLSKRYYHAITGEVYQKYSEPLSRPLTSIPELGDKVAKLDRLYTQLIDIYPNQSIEIQIMIPQTDSASYAVYINPDTDVYYRRDIRFYDQYTLSEIKTEGVYTKPYTEASLGNRIFRMNYDIHTGRIGGIPGKILLFCISLMCATLPITGACIWIVKKRKSKK